MTIRNISKYKNHATPVKRSDRHFQKATIEGLPEVATVLESVLEWRLIREMELMSSESANGTVVSRGTDEWTINRRSIPLGTYQVKFTASLTIRLSASLLLRNLSAFDYGFIKISNASIKVIIDGGSKVRWGSNENVTVNGYLSYDKNIGPGDLTGLNFTWSCRDSGANASVTLESWKANVPSSVNIETSQLHLGKTYVLRLTVTKGARSSFDEMSFELVQGNIPHVSLRYLKIEPIANCNVLIYYQY